jgi:hypothetical protein
VGVLVICVLLFTVFLYCFVYVYLFLFTISVPVPVAARSKAVEIVDWNPTGDMGVCLLSVLCCQVEVSATS